jgi:hypothetical protein
MYIAIGGFVMNYSICSVFIDFASIQLNVNIKNLIRDYIVEKFKNDDKIIYVLRTTKDASVFFRILDLIKKEKTIFSGGLTFPGSIGIFEDFDSSFRQSNKLCKILEKHNPIIDKYIFITSNYEIGRYLNDKNSTLITNNDIKNTIDKNLYDIVISYEKYISENMKIYEEEKYNRNKSYFSNIFSNIYEYNYFMEIINGLNIDNKKFICFRYLYEKIKNKNLEYILDFY